MACWRRHCNSCLQLLLLAVFQASSDAYLSVKCSDENPSSVLHLQSKGVNSAVIVELNVTPTAEADLQCRLEVQAPQGFELTVHLAHPKAVFPLWFLPCYITLSDAGMEDMDTMLKDTSRTIDLCDNSEISMDAVFLSNHLTLTWRPPENLHVERMISTRLIITTIGRGVECNTRHHYLCFGGGVHFPTCIPSELTCDGYNNCPLGGDDERPEDCGSMTVKRKLMITGPDDLEDNNQTPHHVIGALLTKAVINTLRKDTSDESDESLTTSAPGQRRQSGFELTSGMLRDMSDMILKKLLNKHRNSQSNDMSTTTIRPPWDDIENSPSEMGSFPGTLAHYGPWGYLLIGMLICGAVLLVCGLWECCCRIPKHTTFSTAAGAMSTAAATTVFIINNANNVRNSSQQSVESPPSPGPPTYDELDQPPTYNSLFPMTKLETSNEVENRVIADNHI